MAVRGVRVDPSFIRFTDVQVGQVYKQTVTATNVGKTSKRIFIKKPKLKLFQFMTSPVMMLAPGLSVSGLLQFTPEEEEVVTDCLVVLIDDVETIEIQLSGFPRTCSLQMESVLDFGCVAASSQIISKHHPITNHGSAPGVFQVHYNGDPSLRLSPISGVIASGATQWLKVELRADKPRQIDEEALVKLQNHSAVSLSIKAEVVDHRLEVFDLKGDHLSCLWFGPVYFGTSHVEKVVLRNNGPQACDWVCVLQETAAGTEGGIDLQMSTDATLLKRMERCSPASQDFSQVLVCVPKHGRLGPYDRTIVTICFSPICKWTKRTRHDSLRHRQDYCLFLQFESVGSRHGFTHQSANSSVELAVTGTGLPVSLVPSPQRFDFPACVTGQRVELLCVLQNACPQLPLTFHFRKLAHFTTQPSKGTIGPGQCQDVVLSFTARQLGNFQMCQILDILGHVHKRSDNKNAAELEFRSFHTITLHLSAVCCSETVHSLPKLHHGTSLAVTNPSKSPLHVRTNELAHRRTRAGSTLNCINKIRVDRQHRTVLANTSRRGQVDTNYAFTKEEEQQVQKNRQIYTDYIRQLRQSRLLKIKERQQEKTEHEVDIGIVPSHGLIPPKLCISDIESSKISGKKLNNCIVVPQNKCSCPNDMISITEQVKSQVSEAVTAVPSNGQEVADCNRTLSAEELYQVDIGPVLVDFGEVCVQSVCVKKLELINHLSAYVWVQLEVDCTELQGSSPLSLVLPPRSHNTLPLTFQSYKLCHFYRPVSYSINKQHPGQILVQAQVVPLALELSTTLLELCPSPTLLVQSGYRSSVTLRNRRNSAAEFTWRPVVTENGILFSVRPATGTVEPYRELECEVVWHPSFSSPAEGDFDLCVNEGNTQRLHCIAKVGTSKVQLADKQVILGSVPLNKTSVRTTILYNTGQNHSYYQVLDVCPLQGMVVSPCEGVVPKGGQAMLKIHFNPNSVIKFDTRVEIALRNMKSVELRVGGSVEPPNVNISVSHFYFSGVYVGSQRAIPFTLTNHSSAVARVTIDLSQYKDFSLQLPQPFGKKQGVRVMEVQGNQTMDCSLVFSPTQVASYDFDLPLMVNGVRLHSPPSSPLLPPSSSNTSSSLSAASWKHMVQTFPHSVIKVTQQRIQATVRWAPLEMSPSSLQFHVEPLSPQSDAYTQTVELKAVCESSMCWQAVIGRRFHWWVNCSAIVAPTEETVKGELCSVTPSSGCLGPSESVCLTLRIRPEAIRTVSGRIIQFSLPLYLGDKSAEKMSEEEGLLPYRELSITIFVHLPSITFYPPQILLTPVPLQTNVTATLTLLAVGYPSGTRVLAEVDAVELEDGTKIQPVSVIFPEGDFTTAQNKDRSHPQSIQSQEANVTSVICCVSFCCAVPLSLCTTITFTEQHFHNRFKVNLCATADSSLLTVWPYMAQDRSEQQIVLKTGATTVEAILQHYNKPSPASGPASSSSSSFDHQSSTNKYSASDSFPDSDSMSDQNCRDEDVSSNRHNLAIFGLPEFPDANSDEGVYHQTVLLAAERWFSFFGWPNGPHPISVPHTLRRIVSKTQITQSSGRTYRVCQNKDSRSVVDMLHHLTGLKIPGIPHRETFPNDIDECTNKILQQHTAMLAFLRVQGACLWHIRPEYLLDVQEFKHWCSLQGSEDKHGLDYSSVDYESLSKRSWTDVLLQIYKVFVLCCVSERGLDQGDIDGILPVNSQPLASNIYSNCELRLLCWLNKHYQDMRKTVWGDAPSSRWIVNFDLDFTDGLVLAALLAAYCPYLICSHFQRMYTTPNSLEQILHNNIIVSQTLTALSLNIDIQPTDLSDPNPVQMLMLCVHLYERLPEYLARDTITLLGSLRSTLSKQVQLKNPSSNPVKYQALILGVDAHLFSLPQGSAVTILPKGSTKVTVHYQCSFLRPSEAVLLFISSSAFVQRATTLAFTLKTRVNHITATNTVKCISPCYQLNVIQLPITNAFNKEAKFRVLLVESSFNPLECKRKKDSLIQQASSKNNIEMMTSEMSFTEDKADGEGSDFLSAVSSVCLKSGQDDTLNIHYLPFSPGIKYCSVLLVSPQVGDMVYMVKATAELPAVHIPVHSLHCEVGQVCEELVRVPRINIAWEKALAIWGQQRMSADEHRRRMLTHTLCSSSVRATTALCKFFKQQSQLMRGADHCKMVTYSVDVSLPQYFTLPSTVEILVKEDTNIPWDNPADCDFVDIPLRFQAEHVGQFTCQVILRSSCDIRVYMLEALVTFQGAPFHLDFSSPAHCSVTQDIPVHNETQQDWSIQTELYGNGFFGPKVLNVPAGTRVSYPLSFHPSTQCIVMGRLSLHNDWDGSEQVFTLRGVGEHPLPVDDVVLHCPVGKTTCTQLDVPNYSQKKLILKVVTDLAIVTGNPNLEIKPGQNTLYTLAVSPWRRGTQKGHVSFVEIADFEEADKDKGHTLGHYAVYFSLEVICEPPAPIKVIEVQCVVQSSVAVEIPVTNPEGELLMLDVYLEGDNLSGASCVSVPPRNTLTYKATFSPGRVGKSTGRVGFQSELVGEICYQLELYGLPPPVIILPQACCQLGKWTRQEIPLVNPTAETLELIVLNSNPRNYTLEMDSGSTIILKPRSSTKLGVCFRPSSTGEGNHTAKITFTCPQLQEWCVLLSGRGLNPESEELLSMSSTIGSSASITIPFKNPTEFAVTLSISLTAEDPRGTICHPVTTDKDVFSIPLSHTEGIELSEGGSLDVPLVFVPKSMELQHTWLCITMKPLSSSGNNSNFSTDNMSSEQESSTICWIYPICGIPMDVPENSLLGPIQCEAGCQLEKKVEVLLVWDVPGNQNQKAHDVSQVTAEDFLCEVHSNCEAERSEVEDCLSASIEAARKDRETGNIWLTLHVVFTPLRPCRRLAVLAVQSVSGRIWEFPLTLIATNPQVDDVIHTEATELGKTSAVGFRLTSTSRRPEPFTVVFSPCSSSEFTVTPTSGVLPPVGSKGTLITVSFTPTTCHKTHNARLTIQATDKQWTYEVRGKTRQDSPLNPCSSFTSGSASVHRSASERKLNFGFGNPFVSPPSLTRPLSKSTDKNNLAQLHS